MFDDLAILLFPLLVTLAAAGDVMTRRISNRLVILGALSFFPLALMSGMPAWLLLLHCLTALVLFLAGLVFFSLGLFGGGDGKLLALAGLWLGFPTTLPFIGFSAIAGGLLAGSIGLFLLLQIEVSAGSTLPGRVLGRFTPSVPYGYALAVGAILATPFSWMMRAAAG